MVGKDSKYSARSFSRLIQDSGDHLSQKNKALELRPVAKAKVSTLDLQAKSFRDEYAGEYRLRTGEDPVSPEPAIIRSDMALSRWAATGAYSALTLEVAVAGLLSQSWLDVPPAGAAAIGVAVAALLSFLFEGAISYVTTGRQPRKTARALRRIAFWSLAVFILLMAVILMTRSPSEGLLRLLSALVGPCLGGVGLILPFISGTLLAAHQHFAWSSRYAKAYADLVIARSEFEGVLDWIHAVFDLDERGGAHETDIA